MLCSSSGLCASRLRPEVLRSTEVLREGDLLQRALLQRALPQDPLLPSEELLRG
jgi:hypothetical protein